MLGVSGLVTPAMEHGIGNGWQICLEPDIVADGQREKP